VTFGVDGAASCGVTRANTSATSASAFTKRADGFLGRRDDPAAFSTHQVSDASHNGKRRSCAVQRIVRTAPQDHLYLAGGAGHVHGHEVVAAKLAVAKLLRSAQRARAEIWRRRGSMRLIFGAAAPPLTVFQGRSRPFSGHFFGCSSAPQTLIADPRDIGWPNYLALVRDRLLPGLW
jgi:hypothetical protein